MPYIDIGQFFDGRSTNSQKTIILRWFLAALGEILE
jgi:hypothetical protein